VLGTGKNQPFNCIQNQTTTTYEKAKLVVFMGVFMGPPCSYY